MPEMDGFEACKRLREQPGTRQIPIIMLTTASSLDSRVKGLDLGADDYITKPFQVRELVARIHARVRRQELDRQAETSVELGNLKLDSKSFQVWVDGEIVKLTRIEFELLRYFHRTSQPGGRSPEALGRSLAGCRRDQSHRRYSRREPAQEDQRFLLPARDDLRFGLHSQNGRMLAADYSAFSSRIVPLRTRPVFFCWRVASW